MAIQDYFERFKIVEKRTQSDNMGGFETTYVEGAEFMAGINTDNSTEMRIAEQQGLKTIYTLNVSKNTPLSYQDIVKRVKDNSYFRVTSNPLDMETPARSNMNFRQMTLEKIDLPIE